VSWWRRVRRKRDRVLAPRDTDPIRIAWGHQGAGGHNGPRPERQWGVGLDISRELDASVAVAAVAVRVLVQVLLVVAIPPRR
jgi:hypothetical protein